MPIAATAHLTGTLFPSATVPGHLLTPMALTGAEGLLEGTVSRAVLDSIDGPSIAYGYRVRLNGEWIPREDLVGPLEIEEGIDTHVALFSFGLAGQQYAVAATTRTWTRTPVEVWTSTGRGCPLSRWTGERWERGSGGEVCRAAGYVLTCDQPDSREPVVRVSCADPAILYDRWELCFEVAPGAGLTRGEICAEALRDAGVPAWDIPAGAVYTKPVQANSPRLFEWLKAFGEPEAWSWRFRPDPAGHCVLEAYVASLRVAPEPPDHVWQLADVVSIDTTPPKDVPSRWVLRGTSIVTSDESGITTRVTRTEVREIYAPKVCLEMQLPDGSVISTGLSEDPEAERLTSVIEDQQRELGGKTIDQLTREWGWYNPAAGKLRTPGAGESAGPVEEGYYTAQAYVDPEGELRAWPREGWTQIGERRQVPTYNSAGTVTHTRTETRTWYRKTMGVQSVGSAIPNVVGAAVGTDGQSYWVFEVAASSIQRIEAFGLSQIDDVTYDYHPETGAARREVQESSGYVSPRTAVEGVPWYVLYDGTGQRHLVAPWGLRSRHTVLNLLAEDGHLQGKVETTEGYRALKRVNGAYNWGDFRSNQQQEQWRPIRKVNTQYNVLSEDAYEEIVQDETGRHYPRLITGRLPLPRFESSPWTSMVQRPIEVVLDDPTVEAWWGFARTVIDSEFVQSLDEARAVATQRRARQLAHQHQVTRPVTIARPGDTVLLIDPRSGIQGRCLITQLRETWTLTPRTQVLATYTLEQPV
jgi:hypothetical protein